jgi:Domain of unknown function (DUF4175)
MLAERRLPVRCWKGAQGLAQQLQQPTVKVPGEIDSQRARRILEELRRRFGEAFRPQLELDYVERLLKDY